MTDSTSGERRITYLPLEDLKADPKNPKSHDLATIDASLNRFGVVDLITVDARTGYIISGHGRTSALREAFARGEAPPDGVQVADDGSWIVPVNAGWASKNDAEAAAALIALNRTTELGGWVDESLLALLEEISEAGANFGGVGYDDDDLEALRMFVESSDMELDPSTVAAREAEWAASGGQDLESENLMAAHRLIVKLKTTEDYYKFLDLLEITEDREIIRGGTWWPPQVRAEMRQSERDEELVISVKRDVPAAATASAADQDDDDAEYADGPDV